MRMFQLLGALAAGGALAGAVAALSPSTAPSMAETEAGRSTVVSDISGLRAALAGARGGDTILLMPGRYEGLVIQGLRLPGGVTIRSRDPARRATLGRFTINGSANLTLADLELLVEPGAARESRITNSQDISLRSLDAHGTLDGSPVADGGALLVRFCQGFRLLDSNLHEVHVGLGVLQSTDVLVRGNHFHDVRLDGIRMAGVSRVVIDRNRFNDFYWVEPDHPDAIQFWTTNMRESASDIAITNNLIHRGKGRETQGIFMNDEQRRFPYRNVRIQGNTLLGTSYHGITVAAGEGVDISGNTVLAYPGDRSWIRVGKEVFGQITNNTSTEITFQVKDDKRIRLSKNRIVRPISPARAAELANGFAN